MKIGFQSHEGKVEWMWVKVQGAENLNLIGTLDNDPLFCTHLIHGDPISLSRLQIAAVDLTIDEWWVEVDALRARGDYFNQFLGSPSRESGFEEFYHNSFTPRQALNRWVKWQPSEDEPFQFLTELASNRCKKF